MGLRLQHLLMEMRYDPSLAFYGCMDKIGLEFSKEYPDWERSPLTLDIRNKKSHRRSYLSHRRAFYESLSVQNLQTELDRATKIFEKLHHFLSFTKVPRFGIRQWFVGEMSESLREKAKFISRKMNPKDEEFRNALRGQIEDVGYTFDVQADLGWKYHLKFGPMERNQWFEIIPHEIGLFDSREEFGKYRDAFPARFFYVDLDCYKDEITYSEYQSLLLSIKTTASEIITDISAYFKA